MVSKEKQKGKDEITEQIKKKKKENSDEWINIGLRGLGFWSQIVN